MLDIENNDLYRHGSKQFTGKRGSGLCSRKAVPHFQSRGVGPAGGRRTAGGCGWSLPFAPRPPSGTIHFVGNDTNIRSAAFQRRGYANCIATTSIRQEVNPPTFDDMTAVSNRLFIPNIPDLAPRRCASVLSTALLLAVVGLILPVTDPQAQADPSTLVNLLHTLSAPS